MFYMALTVACTLVGLAMVRHAFKDGEAHHLLVGIISLCVAALFLILLMLNNPLLPLNHAERQAPYYQDAANGTPSAMLAYCDNAPRYFGDCLARLELEATVTAQARGER